MAEKWTTKQYAYYTRLNSLVLEIGNEVLKAIFDDSVPPSDFANFLQNNRKKFFWKNGPLTAAQKNKLYPKQGLKPTTSDEAEIDISLFIVLMKETRECKLNQNAPCWEWNDRSIPDNCISREADIMRIKNLRNKLAHKKAPVMEEKEFEDDWKEIEQAFLRLGDTLIDNLEERIGKMKTRNLDEMSPELKNLKANSKDFFANFESEDIFVETEAYRKTTELLQKYGMVVLTGPPGEGKTTLAVRLALDCATIDRCLYIPHPNDWRHVDLELRLFDAIVIDDIFGDGAFKRYLSNEWEPKLKEIYRAVNDKKIKVIITSRDYIVENARDSLSKKSFFKDESMYLLSSKNLSTEEKTEILRRHMQKSRPSLGRVEDEKLINNCVSESTQFCGGTERDFRFGFPECVEIFVKNDMIYERGADFFKKPNKFFKDCLEDLFSSEDEDKRQSFFALVTVWANEGKLSEDTIEISGASEELKNIARNFGFELKGRDLSILKKGLKFHDGGFLVYTRHTGVYTFAHGVIGDMVGLVAGKEYPKQVVTFCGRDFLLEYVRMNKTPLHEFSIPVEERHISHLAEKCLNLLLRRNCNSNYHKEDTRFLALQRKGERPNKIIQKHDIDIGILEYEGFEDKQFVKFFMDHVLGSDITTKVFNTPVMCMSGFFYHYGIKIETTLDMCLTAYSIYSGKHVFIKEVFERDIKSEDLQFALMWAVHSSKEEMIDIILEHGSKVDGNSLYIAMHRKDLRILDKLLAQNEDVNDRGNLVHGNFPITVACRKGFYDAVKRLIDHKTDLTVQNDAKMTALHKAIIYKHTELSKLLIENGAPLDVKNRTFKKTPLHIAADMGQNEVIQVLLQNGASLRIKDHRGHYPLHCAAIRGNVEAVKIMLQKDPSQETLRVTSYRKKSLIKGMAVFHVVVWKKNIKLLKFLIEFGLDPNIKDWFGQTPLFCAVFAGYEDMAKMLIAYSKTDVNTPQKKGYTPLHLSIFKSRKGAFTKLMKHNKINVNQTDKYGKTPLHVACEIGDFEAVNALLDHNADTRIFTKRKDSVLHLLQRTATTRKLPNILYRPFSSFVNIQKRIVEVDKTLLDFLKDKPNKVGQLVAPTLSPSPHAIRSASRMINGLREVAFFAFLCSSSN